MDKESFVSCENLVKIYKIANVEVVALQGLNLRIHQGEMIGLIGPSGVGKSTLLNVIGGLDTPSAGSVWVGGWDLLRMKDPDRVRYKREVVGFVWQQPSRNLLPYLTAQENVELPMQHSGVETAARKKRALELLETVLLVDRAGFLPDRLSGGEQQRVALAVALANNPSLVLGDELTGQVDSESAMEVVDALQAINRTYGTTIIVVTHDPLVASRMDRVVTMRDGRTSTEIHRFRDPEDGSVREEEWIILDPVGRLQLPRGYVSTLDMRELVRVHLQPDHISVWPHDGYQEPSIEYRQPLRDIHRTPAADIQARDPARDKSLGDPKPPSSLAAHRLEEAEHHAIDRSLAGVTITTTGLTRTFELAGEEVHALREVNLEIPGGSMAVIRGPSGSGKTTLLQLLAGLDEPTAGAVHFGERVLGEMSLQERSDLIREQIGFVFQTFGLLPFLSVEENVQLPLRLLRTPSQERQALVEEMLEMVRLAGRAKHRAYELSGGEQQRVAIARALVKRPSLILADEPTGHLDSLTGAGIMAFLRDIVTQTGVTLVVASHDPYVQEDADWVFQLVDGRLVKAENRVVAKDLASDG